MPCSMRCKEHSTFDSARRDLGLKGAATCNCEMLSYVSLVRSSVSVVILSYCHTIVYVVYGVWCMSHGVEIFYSSGVVQRRLSLS